MSHWQKIAQHISDTTQNAFIIKNKSSLGGGSINAAYKVTGENNAVYFVKHNHANLQYMFQVEFDSLNELQQTRDMLIPSPVCFGTADNYAYLVLEYIEMTSRGNHHLLGGALANMHRITQSQFGWYQDNIIGSTPQSNKRHSDWLSFWRDERLLPQFKMLYDKGYKTTLNSLSEKLLNNLEHILAGHQPVPSLLHGDLWSGNYAFNTQGHPVIFDPALYYGDRETDMAMTELFGGFSADFYSAYNDSWPLEEGYQKRKILYNLYHILNHANLFGSSYLHQAIGMMERLC